MVFIWRLPPSKPWPCSTPLLFMGRHPPFNTESPRPPPRPTHAGEHPSTVGSRSGQSGTDKAAAATSRTVVACRNTTPTTVLATTALSRVCRLGVATTAAEKAADGSGQDGLPRRDRVAARFSPLASPGGRREGEGGGRDKASTPRLRSRKSIQTSTGHRLLPWRLDRRHR
jgi:hypothetical protein